VIERLSVAGDEPKNAIDRFGRMVSARLAGILRKAPTVSCGRAVRASVGRAVYSSVIDTVGVIVREIEAPAAATVAENVGVIERETVAGVIRIASTFKVGAMSRVIDAGVIRSASTVRVGDAIRAREVGRTLIALTERVGVTESDSAAPNPPMVKEAVGEMVRETDPKVTR
jgi:hypothetical protein